MDFVIFINKFEVGIHATHFVTIIFTTLIINYDGHFELHDLYKVLRLLDIKKDCQVKKSTKKIENNQIAIWQRFINWLRGMLYLPIDTDENERQATRKDFRQKLVIIGEALKKYSSDVNSNKRRKEIL